MQDWETLEESGGIDIERDLPNLMDELRKELEARRLGALTDRSLLCAG